MKFEWKNLSVEKPICTETGNWDGKKSDEIITRDYNGKHFITYCYEGFMDGSYFLDFYSVESDYQIEGVIFWANIPDPR